MIKKLKSIFLVVLIFAFFVNIFYPITVFADPSPRPAKTPEEKATSWTYFRGLSYCILEGRRNYSKEYDYVGTNILTKSDVESAKFWLDGTFKPAIGYSLLTPNKETYSCGDSGWIEGAFLDLGFSDMFAAAESLGFEKVKMSDGVSVYQKIGDYSIEEFRSAVGQHVNPEGDFDNAAQYIQELKAFSAGCLGKSNLSYLKTDALSESQQEDVQDKYKYTLKYYDKNIRDVVTGVYKGVAHGTNVWYRVNINGDKADNGKAECYNDGSWSKTLGSLKDSVNSRVEDYKKAIEALMASGSGEEVAEDLFSIGAAVTTGSKVTCGSLVAGVGWIVCPLIDAMSAMNDGMWNFVENILFVNPLSDSSVGIYESWGIMRNLANIIFVIVFLIIILSQLTGAGVTNYGVKKLLPKIIVVAIAVNLSFILMQLAIDVTNIVGRGLYEAIINSPKITLTEPNWGLFLDMVINGGGTIATAGLVLAGGAVVMGFPAALLALVPALLSVAVAWFAAVITLIFRQAAIPLLAMVAPLAFVAYLLPNTEQWFKKWYKLLLNMLMLYPMAALIFAGARFAGNVIIGEALDEGESFKVLMGLMVIGLPMFSLPFISRQGAPMLAKLNGALSNIGKRVTAPVGDFSKELSKNAKVRADNAAMNNPRNAFGRVRQRYLRFKSRRGAVNQNQQAEFNRGEANYISDEAINNETFRGQMAAGGAAGADRRALASAINVRAEIETKEVKAANAVIDHFNFSAADIQNVAKGAGNIRGVQVDDAMREAAIMRSGAVSTVEDMEGIIKSSGSMTESQRRALVGTITSNGFTSKAGYLGGKTLGDIQAGNITNQATLDKAIVETVEGMKISAEDLVAMDAHALKRIKEVVSDSSQAVDQKAVDALRAQANRAKTDDILISKTKSAQVEPLDGLAV